MIVATIPKAIRQITGIKVTPVLKGKLKNSKFKFIVHTYSGEYFPLYKNDIKKRIRHVNDCQGYD